MDKIFFDQRIGSTNRSAAIQFGFMKKKLLKPSFRVDRIIVTMMNVKRLVFIKRCRDLDISLNEIESR